jgi:hypothetical protein
VLEGNRQRVKNLSGGEIWLFIVARVLIGFAVGILAMVYFPSVASQIAWPALVVGVILFILASRGLFRRPSNSSEP